MMFTSSRSSAGHAREQPPQALRQLERESGHMKPLFTAACSRCAYRPSRSSTVASFSVRCRWDRRLGRHAQLVGDDLHRLGEVERAGTPGSPGCAPGTGRRTSPRWSARRPRCRRRRPPCPSICVARARRPRARRAPAATIRAAARESAKAATQSLIASPRFSWIVAPARARPPHGSPSTAPPSPDSARARPAAGRSGPWSSSRAPRRRCCPGGWAGKARCGCCSPLEL